MQSKFYHFSNDDFSNDKKMQSNGYEIFKSVIPSEECEILMKKIGLLH